MRIMANKYIRRSVCAVSTVLVIFDLLLQVLFLKLQGRLSLEVAVLSLFMTALVLYIFVFFFIHQDKLLQDADSKMKSFLSGDINSRIDCNQDGELFVLFQSINTLSSVLNAQAEHEKQRNEFLKTTISDISHQLKTPLAALNIYNGLISEAEDLETARRFVCASENELDRINSLIVNLLKLARLDAGYTLPDKHPESLADIMFELKQRFSARATLESKEIVLDGGEELLNCDASWLAEAFGNLIKNALDHTSSGGIINISWRKHNGIETVTVKDNGCGIHPEDINHVFKRFYRSRYSKDIQGIGLGLSFAKAVIDAHGGTIEVESELGKGTTFVINFIILTEM